MIIANPKVEDTGKYTIEIMGMQSTAFLNVDGEYGCAAKIAHFHPTTFCNARLHAIYLGRTGAVVLFCKTVTAVRGWLH